MPRGKFFTLHSANFSATLVELKDGSPEPGAAVVTARPAGGGEAAADHQLWWVDKTTNSICSKLNDYCLCSGEDNKVIVAPYQPMNRYQRWYIDGGRIRSRYGDHVIGLNEAEKQPSGQLYRQDEDESFGDEWSREHVDAHYIHIKHCGTGKVLDVCREGDHQGAAVIVYDIWLENKDNQLWYEDEDGIIRSKINDFALTSSGNDVAMYPYEPKQQNQEWVISQHVIVNRHDPDLVLDISTPRLAFLQNIKVVAAEYNGSAQQRWDPMYADNNQATFGPSSRFVQLRHEMSGLLLTALPLSSLGIPSSRVDVVLESCKQGSPSNEQLWAINKEKKRIWSAVDGMCLDLSGPSMTGKGEEVVLQPLDPHSRTQAWLLEAMTIQNISGPKLYLGSASSVLTPDSSDITRVVARKLQGEALPEFWKATSVPARFFYIRTQLCDKVLDVKYAKKDSGGEVIIYDRKPGPPADNQLWYEDEEGLIRSKVNGYLFDSGGKTVVMRPYRQGAVDQQWVIFGDVIKNRARPDLCLDVYRERKKNETPIISYRFGGGLNQRWMFEFI